MSDKRSEYLEETLDFTGPAMEAMYSVVDNERFREEDVGLIYRQLQGRLRAIPFGEYLKRWLYREAEMTDPYGTVETDEYCRIIRDCFRENGTPASFTPTSAKISALSRNWLTQQTVHRRVVFLLGFGLRMNVRDVQMFLTKALQEHSINAKSPFEVICWYCYRFGLRYSEMQRLQAVYEELPPGTGAIFTERTADVHRAMLDIRDEASLMEYLAALKTEDERPYSSITAKAHFDRLYSEIRQIIAALYNQQEEERIRLKVERARRKMENNDRLYDFEKQQRLDRVMAKQYDYSAEDITPADLERIFYEAVPKDAYGNLIAIRKSSLNGAFSGRRFSRQRMNQILSGQAEISRFDLITLNFFIYANKVEEIPAPVKRYSAFIASTDGILEECGMGKMYIASPYECFLLMSILSEDPIGTYADVWRMSYGE